MFTRHVPAFFVFFLMAILSFPKNTEAQDSSWVGKTVVFKKSMNIGYTDDEGNARRIRAGFHPIQKVLKEKDGRLFIRYRGIDGWFDKNDAVLLENAVAFFTDKIRTKPDVSEWHNLRGETFIEQKKIKHALKDFDEAIRLQPKEGTYYANRAEAHFYLKAYAKAVADFDAAIRLDPFQPVYYSNRAIFYFDMKEYQKAVSDRTEAIRLGLKDAVNYSDRGSAYVQLKEYHKAIADCDKAIRLDPKDPLAYSIRAEAYEGLKEFRKAIADYNKAIELNPKEFFAYNGRAWLWATCPDEKIRNGKKAVESAKRACELKKWKELRFIDTLAAAYAESGDFEKAVKYQTQSLEDPELAKDEGARKRLELYKKKKPYRDTGE